MRTIVLPALFLAVLVGCAGENGNAGGNIAAESSDTNQSLSGSGGADAGPTGLEDTAPPSTLGTDCAVDGDCSAGEVCHRGVCVATCSSPADCGGGDCSADAAGRMVCSPAAYAKAIGTNCGATGKCPDGTQCIGVPYSAFAVCSAACADDTDCPMNFYCGEAQGQKVCLARAFCSLCNHDGNCGEGNSCTEQGGQKFCSRGCTPGGNDCPRYAACQDVGNGNFQCVHKAGSCIGDGALCSACTGEGQCEEGAACLTYNHTKESFCATACSGSCPANYNCVNVGAGTKCVPASKTDPKCVSSVNAKHMDVGDIMEDYAMIGMVDTNDDGILHDEEPRLIQMSDFADHHELILLNVSAVWCSACQAETKDMRATLYKTYYPKGLVLMQTLYDGQKPGDPMTFGLLKAWQNQLKPAGAVGMDPQRWVIQYNTGNSTPLNMLIDAKTRKVLYKVNGYNRATLESQIKKALAAKGL